MTHYVCTGGCGGVSDNPGVCNAQNCSLNGKPLKACHCADGNHKEGRGLLYTDGHTVRMEEAEFQKTIAAQETDQPANPKPK